jgi:nicotinamidase-related amidase
VIFGIETHVCVYQTALDLRRDGRQVVLAADAVSSRRPSDREAALARMRDLDVHVVSTEMVLFEILRQAGTPDFRAVAPILKE